LPVTEVKYRRYFIKVTCPALNTKRCIYRKISADVMWGENMKKETKKRGELKEKGKIKEELKIKAFKCMQTGPR
jgi:hypothetical protein